MHLDYPPEVKEFQAGLRAFLDRVTPAGIHEEVAAHHGRGGGPLTWALWRELGRAGYLGVSWPREFGGQGKSFLYVDALFSEMFYRDLPMAETTLLTIGPTLMRVGTPAQQHRYLPEIISGEVDYALGYSEPSAGTDLASMTTRATPVSGGFVINGQKIFTSRAEYCQYIWLAARTDPDRQKTEGISVFIVPVKTKGVRIDPFFTMARRTNLSFYDDVFVPQEALVGQLNAGWNYVTSQLALERLVVSPVPELRRLMQTLRGIERSLGQNSWLQTLIVEFEADLQALEAMRLKVLSMIVQGRTPSHEVAVLKIASNECRVRMLGAAMQAAGPRALLRDGRESDAFVEEISGVTLEYQMRSSFINLFGGGSNDVLRELVASRGLGLGR